jgi:PilZ domain
MAVHLPVRVSASADEVACVIKSVSLSGALVESECDLGIQTFIDVRIALPPPSSRIAVVKAHVSRKLQDGVGIEWCEFAPTIVKDLLRSPMVRFPL